LTRPFKTIKAVWTGDCELGIGSDTESDWWIVHDRAPEILVLIRLFMKQTPVLPPVMGIEASIAIEQVVPEPVMVTSPKGRYVIPDVGSELIQKAIVASNRLVHARKSQVYDEALPENELVAGALFRQLVDGSQSTSLSDAATGALASVAFVNSPDVECVTLIDFEQDIHPDQFG
jgi:hypothetical protein